MQLHVVFFFRCFLLDCQAQRRSERQWYVLLPQEELRVHRGGEILVCSFRQEETLALLFKVQYVEFSGI